MYVIKCYQVFYSKIKMELLEQSLSSVNHMIPGADPGGGGGGLFIVWSPKYVIWELASYIFLMC